MMQITASKSTANQKSREWNNHWLTAYESGEMPKDTLLICIHDPDDHPQNGKATVAIDRTDLIRFLRAIEATTETEPQ